MKITRTIENKKLTKGAKYKYYKKAYSHIHLYKIGRAYNKNVQMTEMSSNNIKLPFVQPKIYIFFFLYQ